MRPRDGRDPALPTGQRDEGRRARWRRVRSQALGGRSGASTGQAIAGAMGVAKAVAPSTGAIHGAIRARIAPPVQAPQVLQLPPWFFSSVQHAGAWTGEGADVVAESVAATCAACPACAECSACTVDAPAAEFATTVCADAAIRVVIMPPAITWSGNSRHMINDRTRWRVRMVRKVYTAVFPMRCPPGWRSCEPTEIDPPVNLRSPVRAPDGPRLR